MKRCSKCNKNKNPEAFAKSKDSKDGLYSTCKECKNRYKRKWYVKNFEEHVTSLNKRFASGKYKAKSKKIKWDIDFDFFSQLLKLDCFYCGKNLSNERGYCLDRINNGDHYHEKNVVQCCGNCNTSRKDNFTHDEWKVMIDALIKHRNRDH